MEETMRVLLFGDQTGDYHKIFRQVLHLKGNAILTSFLEKAYSALRDEVAQQPRAFREHTTDFTSIADLVTRYEESNARKNNALESALTFLSQISCFICSQGDGSQEFPSPSNTRIVGSCTGLLAAAAVSSSISLIDLVPIAIEVLRIAFRVGVRVTEVRDQIEQEPDCDPSWSAVVSGIGQSDAIDAIDSFNDEKCIPKSSRAYISAISPSALTISGPHSILNQLFQYNNLRYLKANRLAIHGPYHAAHLYNEDEPKKIMLSISETVLKSHIPKILVRSTGAREWFSATTLGQLLEEVLRDILMRTLHWDDVLDSVNSVIRDSGHSQCIVLRLGPSNTGQSLVSALRQNKDLKVSLDDRFTGELDNIITEESSGRLAHSKIAICGLSGRFPDAASPEAFWELLEKGLDLHRVVPSDRFDVSTHVDADGKRTNTSHTPFGCFIKDPGLFDPRFFGISPREAAQTDPMQRLALVTAYEALEMSGYVPNRTPSTHLDRIGTFYGQTSDDWREIQAAQKVDTYFIPGGVRAFGPGRINYHFKFSGPSFNIDTACSSSLAAIQLACTSLWAGDCDTALAGGMNVLTNPDIFSGLSRGQFLSKRGSCQTFDNEADGYCRADGVGTVVLKRLEDAKADKDPILAVILGSATNHSAEAISITHPHAGAQEFLYKKVLNAASVDPHDVSYVEMHGTGTQAGDAIEMQSVTNVFAPRHRQRRSDQQLHLGAVKANAGHGEAASGITSLIKCLFMLDKNLIPPHCGIKGNINRTFPKDLDKRNVHIPFKLTPWDRPKGGKRRLFLNNFSAAGGNTALLLEDAPVQVFNDKRDPRSHHIVAISAKSKYSLKQNVKSLLETLDKSQVDLPSLSYTTTARRIQHNHRVTVSGDSIEQIKDSLNPWRNQDCSPITTATPEIIFTFTGQGAHYAEMGKQLFETCPQFQMDIKNYDAIGISQGFPSIQPLIDGTVTDIQTLSTVVVQLGAVCMQLALFKLWNMYGIRHTAVVGHSLGEYAALCAAGVTSVSDTIFLVGKRAKMLEEQCHVGSHTMLAVKGSAASIDPLLDGQTFEIACINAPEETVVSGTNINIDMLSEDLKEQGFKSTKLTVPYAFHSAQVESILDGFEAAARGVTFNVPAVPVISPLLSEVIENKGRFDSFYLRRHCRETVNFLGGMEAARRSGIAGENTIWIEIGSHPICSSMIKATLGSSTTTLSTLRRKEDNWKVLTNSLCTLHTAGLSVDWSEYHRDFSSSLNLLRLPTYEWENKNYWIDYKNDWCLVKGDAAAAADIPSQKSKLSNASVHRIAEENIESETPTITVESDLADPDLKEAIKGHEVNGFGLCPPSLYADMALTVAEYVYKEKNPEVDHVDLNVCNMKVEKPLIVDDREHQYLRVSGNANMASRIIDLTVYSVDAEGKKTITHATCAVKYEDAKIWIAGWARSRFMVRSRIEALIAGVESGKNHLIRRGMAYKLFGGLIHYSTKYQGMEEVILDSSQLEATSCVAFQPGAKDANFFISPYVIDSVAHLSGFIMLANDNADTTKSVYVSHGWENCRVARPFQMDKKYRSYVKMEATGENVVIGDVYVFDEEDYIVAVVEGLQFHSLPRQLLDSILSAAGGAPKAVPRPKVASQSPKSSTAKTKSSPKTTPVKSLSPKSSENVSNGAIKICAEEIGVSVADLSDGSSFADMGMDSLLSLTVSGKFREAFNIDVPSSLFMDYPTVRDLRGYLAKYDSEDDKLDAAPEAEASSAIESASGNTTPVLETESQTSFEDGEEGAESKGRIGEKSALIRSTIAVEMEVPIDDIDESTDLAELGMDSLMSLQVLGKLREETGEDLSSDFFTEHTTFGEIEQSLNPKAEPPRKGATKDGALESQENQKINDPSKPDYKPLPSATSILIQGNPKSASKTLFLFPDGSGSATSYSPIPNLSPHLAIYGLNCPFIKCPEDYTIGIPGVASLYLTEVRRRQPHGPYAFGGWSAGGVCAYETALQMQSQGQVVDRLVLLDAPCPIRLDPLPSRLHHFFDSINLLGPEGNPAGPPGWLLPHFDRSIANLSAYDPTAMDPARAPDTYALWATDGVCTNPDDPRPEPESDGGSEPESMKWLLDDRIDLQYNGWDQLIPANKFVRMESVSGVNHFTLMRRPHVDAVGAFLKLALGVL